MNKYIRLVYQSSLVYKKPIVSYNKRFLTSNTKSNGDAEQHQNQQQSKLFSEDFIKNKILESSLQFVPQFGFTVDAIEQGAVATGYSGAVKGIFKNDSFDLIDFFYKKSNEELGNYLEKIIAEGKITSKTELIRVAILYRLSLIQSYIEHWPKAMAIQSLNPSYALVSIENLLRLCDEIWHQLGDKSVDINWYTKRLTLAAIYKSTEFYMIQDKSENFKETKTFLDNRLNDLEYFHRFKNETTNIKQGVLGSLTVVNPLRFLQKLN